MATLSKRTSFLFKGSSDKEINDVIYPGEEFPLKGQSYKFVIHPLTTYWRFGLRFSKGPTVEFSQEIRHGFKNQMDFQVATGQRPSSNMWLEPGKLEISKYEYSESTKEMEQQIYQTFNLYQSKGDVSFDLHHNAFNKELFIHVNGKGIQPTQIQLPVDGYEVFQLFAWADALDFELDCEIYRSTDANDKSSFVVDNIEFRFGDLFEKDNLRQTGLVVLPVSTNGTVQQALQAQLKDYAIEKPSKGSAGDVKVLTKKDGIRFGWAYTVIGTEGSNAKVLKSVCSNIRENAKNFEFKNISLPLLATGAGKLNYKHVAKTFIDQFKKDAGKTNYIVYVNIAEWFGTLFEEFGQPQSNNASPSQNSILFDARRFIFKDKHGIDPVLNVTDVAEELSELIQKLPDQEQEGMIGVFGKWGRGKTFLLKETWKILEKTKAYDKIEFDAWKYQDTPAIWGYLSQLFTDKFYSQANGWWQGLVRRIRLNIFRLGTWKIWYVLIPLIFSIAIAIVPLKYKFDFLAGLISYGLIGLLILYFQKKKSIITLFAEYSKKISYSQFLGAQAEIQKDLKSLLQVWAKYFAGKKIILIVEDIDRCDEGKIIQIIDSMRVILEDIEIAKRLTVLVSIDERILQMAIQKKYENLFNASGKEDVLEKQGKEYLDKLFILAIRLGELSLKERDEFFIALSKEERQEFAVVDLGDILVKKIKKESNKNEREEAGAIIANNRIEVTDTITLSDTIEISVNKERLNLKNEKLSESEFNLVRRSLVLFPTLTPRQIRIFFYRFMVARNLLAKVYSKNNRTNVWQNEINYKYFVDSLIKFSLNEGRSKLTEEKLKALDNSQREPLKIKGSQLDDDDYKELLKVLDLVIAY